MKYFTREWHSGQLDDAEFERRVKVYWLHINEILPKLPKPCRDLATGKHKITLHDAKIRKVTYHREKKQLCLSLSCGDLQIGYFDLDITYFDVMDIEKIAARLQDISCNPRHELLYDEIDIDELGHITHSILFWPKKEGEIEIRFARLEYEKHPFK